MPHVVAISCPSCRGSGTFEFAEVVRIALRRDVSYFQEHPLFDYELCQDSTGNRWHAAWFFAGLHVRDESALRDLPAGYSPSDWSHSKHLYRAHGTDRGTASCMQCDLRRRHHLTWPDEALFQVSYRGHVLWAFHRESAVDLRAYIASEKRDRSKYRWEVFLQHVPEPFLAAAARSQVVRLLDQLLSS